MGLPHAVAVTTADVTDRDGAIQMLLGGPAAGLAGRQYEGGYVGADSAAVHHCYPP